jgi:drug/metabolite transporter (DMT)-like permease
VPASCDFVTSNLQYIALTMLQPSIYQMLRGGVVLVTALFSVVFLKKKLQLYHYLGCALVFMGVMVVGIANFVLPAQGGEGPTAKQQLVGTLLIIVSLFFNGFLFVSEEKLFKVFHILPYEMVGTEGGWGLLLNAIILPILSTQHCPQSWKGTCV